jgi:hypothetical protein
VAERMPCSRCRGRGTIRPIGLGLDETCPTCGGTGQKPNRRAQRRPLATAPASEPQRDQVRGQACRGCGKSASRYRTIDPAHVTDRAQGGCDDPLCCVPLCRTAAGGCHRDYDEGKLDLLPKLAFDEQAHAVGHLGLLGALRRTTGDRYEPARRAA